MLSLGLEVEGRQDIIIDLRAPGTAEKLKEKPFTIKEGAVFRMKTAFRVQHQILSGMKYLQVVKKMGLSNKTQEMIVSYLVGPDSRRGMRGGVRRRHLEPGFKNCRDGPWDRSLNLAAHSICGA